MQDHVTTARAPACRGSGRTSFACSAGRPPALQAGHMFWPDFPIRLSRLGFVPVTRGFGHLRPSACIVQLGSFGELRCFAPCVNPHWANRETLHSVPEIDGESGLVVLDVGGLFCRPARLSEMAGTSGAIVQPHSSFRGASATSEPGIQKQESRMRLDSGSGPAGRPGMTTCFSARSRLFRP